METEQLIHKMDVEVRKLEQQVDVVRSIADSLVASIAGDGGGAGSSALVSDTFTDSDGTLLTAHTPDVDSVGGGWSNVLGSTIDINTNKARGGASDYPAAHSSEFVAAKIDAGNADVTVSADVNQWLTGGADWAELALRIDAGGDWWAIQANPSSNKLRILQRQGATNTERAFSNVTVTAGVDYAVSAVLSGSTITAKLDGANECSYGSATMNQTETQHGFAISESTNQGDNATLDNFEVTA